MAHSIFHPSGRPSLTAVREWLSLMPCAVVISDVITSEVIAYSPIVEDMYGADGEGTGDGSHPNDLGAYRMAKALTPMVQQLIANPE